MNFLAGLSFAWPLGALFAAFAPLLVVAYLRRERKKRMTVSSTLLYANLPKRARARRKFKPPLQFFLELLALLALLLAIVGPFREEKHRHTAIVLDTSLSMAAEDPEGRSHFDAVLLQAAELLRQDASDTRYSVYRSSPVLTLLGEPRRPAPEVLPLLETATTAAGTDSLNAALQELQNAPEAFDRIVVLSDRIAASGSSQDYARILSSNKSIENTFVESLRFKEGSRSEIEARIGASSDARIEGRLRLYGLRQLGTAAELIKEVEVSIRPPNTTTTEISLSRAQQSLLFFRAEFLPQQRARNGLAIDDSAWLSVNRSGSSRILLIGFPQGQAGLDRLGQGEVSTMSIEEYATLGPSAASSYDLLLFYAAVPREAPKRPSLFILPPEGTALLPIRREVENAIPSSWEAQHALLRYISIPKLTPARALVFETPPWARAILRAPQGPIAIAGSLDGVPMLALGFEVLPFEGRATPTSSILLLNALQWLSGGNELTNEFQIGSSIRLSPDRSWVLREPNGELLTRSHTDVEGSEYYRFLQSGVYVVTGKAPGSPDTETRVYVVQGYTPQESHTLRPPELALPGAPAESAVPVSDVTNYWKLCAALALAVLLLQALLTSSRWSASWS